MKKPAFTLLETMIALAIVVIGIAAGAQISRVVFLANQQSEDSIQATNLADEAIRLVQLTDQYVQHTTSGSKNLSDYFRLPGQNQTIYLLPYMTTTSPTTVFWCIGGIGDAGIGVVTNTCSSLTSKVLAANGATQTFQTLLSGSGDSIAVNRAATADSRLIVDATTTTGSSVSYNQPQWDYYTRTIAIQEVPVVNGVTGSYQVTVTVQNPLTHFSVQRSILLTDNAS